MRVAGHRIGVAVLVALTAGCDAVAPETLLGELRVISVRSDPPVWPVDGPITVTATAFRPDPDQPTTVMLWSCTPGPLGCGEAGTEADPVSLEAWVATTPLASGQEDATAAWPTSPPLPGDQPTPALVWALACEDGRCPVLDQVAAGPPPGGEAWSEVVAQLADPLALVETLPKEGVALSFRGVPVVDLPEGAPVPDNPTVSLVAPAAPLTVPSGGTLELTVSVTNQLAPARVYPMATAGGFEGIEAPVEGEEATVTLVAGNPEVMEAPPVPVGTVIGVYVLAEADDFGSALWRGEVTVVD